MIYKPFALFLIAASVICTGAAAGKVYKCGNSYSQVPCADGVELTTPAEPSAQQQRAARKSSQWDEKTGSALEKERLNGEKAALKEQLAADKARKAQGKSDEKEKTKDSKKSKKEPEFFIAKAPAAKASQPK